MAWWETILRALWLFLPAYVANMAPVFVAKIIPNWNAPMDGGRLGKDGKRILGAGKTWRGLVGGAVFGGLIVLLMVFIARHWELVWFWDYGVSASTGGPYNPACHDTPDVAASCAAPAPTPLWAAFVFGSFVGAMALVGDAVKSYFKRRTGRDGGAPWFPFDQLDFVVFGLLGMLIASPLLSEHWVWSALTHDWLVLFTLIVLTPGLHLLVNRIGFWLGLKKVPW